MEGGKMALIHLNFLGEFTVHLAGQPLEAFATDKNRALLAFLAVEAGRSHRRESLIGMFWPQKPEHLARHSLSQALFSLRKLFQMDPGVSLFEATPKEIKFQLDDCWLDTRAFDELNHRVAGHGHGPDFACRLCTQYLEEAAALFRGDFLAGFSLDGCAAFEEWLLTQREFYRQKLLSVLQQLAANQQHLGNYEAAFDCASRWVALDSLDEAAHRQVMRLHSLQGREAAALEQYRSCQDILDRELGVEPQPETTDLYQHIAAHKPVADLVPAVRHNLPSALTPCIGRQVELEKICLKLVGNTCRLLTLLGPGGSGKTRLALEAGRALIPVFPDGVFLVSLNTSQSYPSLAPIIAQALELRLLSQGNSTPLAGTRSISNQLCRALQNQKVLLLLDGFEGMLPEINLVLEILHRAPKVKVLVTSRTRLNLEGEHIFYLDGLSYPSQGMHTDLGDYGSIQLFVNVAQRTQPGFELYGENRVAVAELCRLVQGLPLGILLAAAWAGIIEPLQILKEIQSNLDFLSVEWLNLPDRHRSLQTTFDCSLGLLEEAEQRVFLHLAVFHGSFSAGRALQVAGASLRDIKFLLDHSLLQKSGPDRYRIHDLLRQYMLEKLDAYPEDKCTLHEHHCRVYLAALADWETGLKSPVQLDVMIEMDQEYDDILAAWDWAVTYGLVDALEDASEGLMYYFLLRGLFGERSTLCQRSMDRLERDGLAPQNIRLWVMLGIWLASSLDAMLCHQESAEVVSQVKAGLLQAWEWNIDVDRQQARLNLTEGFSALWTGLDRRQALDCFQQSLELFYQSELDWDISLALASIATCHDLLGNIPLSQRFSEEGLAIQRRIGDPQITNRLSTTLGYSHMLAGNHKIGLRLIQEQNAYRQRIDQPHHQAESLSQLGLALHHSGQFEQSSLLCRQAVAAYTAPEDSLSRNFSKFVLACNDLLMGNYGAVLRDEAWLGEPKDPFFEVSLGFLKGWVRLLGPDVLGVDGRDVTPDLQGAEQEIQSYLALNRALPRLDMLGLPLALLAYIAYRRGDLEHAREYLIEGLGNGIRTNYYFARHTHLAVLACILADHGKYELAEELFAMAQSHPFIGNAQLFDDFVGKGIANLTSNLPEKIREAARERGREGDVTLTLQTYLDLLSTGGWDRLLHNG
jgi:DNA-binding SARP family transcriptional activator/predicted ATPase